MERSFWDLPLFPFLHHHPPPHTHPLGLRGKYQEVMGFIQSCLGKVPELLGFGGFLGGFLPPYAAVLGTTSLCPSPTLLCGAGAEHSSQPKR